MVYTSHMAGHWGWRIMMLCQYCKTCEEDNYLKVQREILGRSTEAGFTYVKRLGILNSEYSRYGPDLSWLGLITFDFQVIFQI